MSCRNFVCLFSFIFIALCGQQSLAQQDSFSVVFNEGIQAYTAKDFPKAKESFTKALTIERHNATVLTNLALVEFQQKNMGQSIALFRHALEINPQLVTAQEGLHFALSQLPIKEVPHQIETYETIRSRFLVPIPLFFYQVLTCILLFSAGWLLIGYWGKRKRALADEAALPPLPVIGLIFTLGFLVCATFLGLKIYDSSIPRGTIVTEKISLHAGPGDDQAPILDLHAGFEVVVRSFSGDWVQVTYPGSLTGWMKKSDLYLPENH